MKVDNLTPVLTAAPGDRATCRLRIENTESFPQRYQLRIIGFDDARVLRPPPDGPLAAGAVEEVALDFVIPDAYAAGHHSVAVEVVSDRAGTAPVIAAVTVTIGSIDDVALAVVPSTIRAHRRASFRLDIDNRSNQPIELELGGEGPDLQVRLRPDRVVLRAGERARTSGRVKGPRHLVGEPLQHSLTVTARSASAPSYAPATFQQRPLFPRGLRSMVAVLLVVAVWAAALGAGFLWWTTREDAEQQETAELVDTDGDGIPDTPGDQLIDTDGDGVGDTRAAVVAEEVAAAGEAGPPQAGGSDRPTRTVMGGTVKAGEGGDPSGVAVSLIERDLGAAPPEAATAVPAGLTGVAGESRGVKLWPARFGRYQPAGVSRVRQTVSIQSTATGPDGAWLFGDVAVGQSYELSFSLPGFDTQSFLVTPSADGEPVQVEVELEPAKGAISGVVVGPAGPLGNVDLVLTNGTLTFETATASSDGVGTFSITGVSTPGTYTLTANLRGFGTEVLQVTLDPGEQRDGVRIGMAAGVGSISGRVTENGEPLGGVSLTASNGDVTSKTTSLTEGDRGAYTFPQLAIPGRYTVTASLDGYTTQTRLVTLNGNVAGVDFDFAKTTGGITGIVASSTGRDLPGANIRVSRDKLAFDTQSAVTPDPGSFTITDLPPGTYLVAFSRYDHAPYSQTVTIAAGQVVDLGRVVLEFRDRPTIPQNGSLEVRVVNSLTEPLSGATVRIIDISTERVIAEQSDPPPEEQSSFLFERIPIGTYRIEVTKGLTYRLSTRRTSVGLGPRVEVIPLYRLGQASGRVVDSFTGEELVDYDVQIIRINPDNSETLVQSIPVRVDTPPVITPTGPQMRWETAAASLTSGNYRVDVVNPPPGYRVVPDQVLVPGLPPMRFVISATEDTPLDLGDIEADRFPEVAGTVLAPQLGAGGATTFDRIEAPGLTVALTCPGSDGVDNTVTLDAPRPVIPPGSQAPDPGLEDTGGGPALDSYFFDRVTLESADLSGACTLEVNAAGYEPAVIPVLVSPGDGSSDPLVFRNIAMIRPDNVGGTTYWLDRGLAPAGRREAVGVSVRTQGSVVVQFDPGETERTDPGSDPTPVLADSPLVQTTGAGGAWAFVDPRQVFGTTNYVFSAPAEYADRIITIRLDEGGREVTSDTPPTGLLLDDTTPVIDVELDANGGVITARANIATIKGTPSYAGAVADVSGFVVDLTGANTATTALARVGGNSGGVQAAVGTFTTDDPGTHQVAFTSTATAGGRPRFVLAGAQPPPFVQEPGAAVDLAPVTFIEQGAVDVRVNDVNGNPIDAVGVNLVNVASGATFPVTTAASPANVVVGGLPVGSTVGAVTSYAISLAPNDTLDLTTARLSLFNENGTLVRFCSLTTSGCGTFGVAQGGQPRAVITVSRFGSITGTVLGDRGDGTFESLVPPALTVTAQRVALDCTVIAAEPARPVIAVGDDFRFSGPPGLYRIQFSHPRYQSRPTGGPPQEAEDICTIPNPDPFGPPVIQNPALTGPVYRVQNDDQRVLDEPFFTLPILPSALTVEVRNDSLDVGPGGVGGPVIGAQVAVTFQSTGVTTTVSTNGAGRADFVLIPGAYNVRVTRADAGTDIYFPVLFAMSVPAGGNPALVEVPLPRVGGAITGDVVAWNSEDDPVAVPAGVQVVDDYDVPDPEAAGATVGTVQNPGPRPPVDAVPADPGAPPGTASTYEILNVASGVHTLSFNDAGGVAYEPPDPIPVTVLGLVSQPAADAVYRAADRTVVVTVGVSEATSSPDEARVRLVDPDNPAGGIPIAVSGCTGSGLARTCTATFTAVPPEIASYAVEVTKPRYGTVAPSFVVAPGDPAVAIPVSATIVGNVATLNGVADRLDTADSAGPLPATGRIELFRFGQPAPIQSVAPGGGGEYSFDVTVRGDYVIVASAPGSGTTPGYAPRSRPITIARTGGAGDLGSVITVPDIAVPRLATFAVTVSGGPAPAPQPPAANLAISTAVTGPRTVEPATTRSGSRFDVVVDPGGGIPAPASPPTYQFTVTSPDGFVPVTVPPTPVVAAVGATLPVPAVMTPRTITGSVSGATTAPSVRATSGTTTIVGTVTGSTYTISLVPNGTWTVAAAAYGSGIGSTSAGVVASTTPNVESIAVTLAPRTVNIGFTTSPASTAIVLAGGAGGSGGSLTLARPENAAFPLAWTATADGYVPQSGTVDRPAAPADPFAPGPFTVTVPAITLVRPVVTATVAPATGTTPVTDAAVFLCPGGGTTACSAATPGAIAMPFAAGVYSATPSSSGSWRVGASRGADVAVPVEFTVSSAGVIAPAPPITLILVAPLPPPAPPPPPGP